MERRKLFTERRRLFSSERISLFSEERRAGGRRSLFSSLADAEPEELVDPKAVCQDCGSEFGPIQAGKRCPNCGGSRVVLVQSGESDKDFSDTDDATDEFLREFSDRTVDEGTLTRIFSERGIQETPDSMIDSGYASRGEGGQICFSTRPDLQRKVFSKLVISVTKELELMPVDSKEALINRLEENGHMPGKAIMLIRKAHNIPEPMGDYLEDSGIKTDLPGLCGCTELSAPAFQGVLSEHYNDAPTDIIEKLKEAGIINVDGGTVKIIKL